jgi:hypothetical protein
MHLIAFPQSSSILWSSGCASLNESDNLSNAIFIASSSTINLILMY